MFRRRREKKALKEAAKAARKAEEEAAGNIQLLRVAPRGTRYGGESPDYPLALRSVQLSRSMDALHEAVPPSHAVVHPLMFETAAPVPAAGKKNKKQKKRGLRRAQSLAEDGMLAGSPQERYQPRLPAIPDGPVYYLNESARPVYLVDQRAANGDAHPSNRARPRYFVSAMPAQSPGTPAFYYQQQQPQYLASPTSPPGGALAPPYISDGKTTATRGAAAGRHRNYVQIIPRPENAVKKAPRPVSQVYNSGPMRPTSTPLRSPSPIRTPSPAVYHTGPRKGKGKAIRVVEGWDEPEDDDPKVVQTHAVGVAPKSKVMDNFNSRNAAGSAPFSITISNDDPAASEVHLREPSRRNKARPVSAAPWISSDGDFPTGASITRQNGHMIVDFNE